MIEPLRIVGRAETLVGVVEEHGAVRSDARGHDIGDERRVVGERQCPIGEESAEPAHDDPALAERARPQHARTAIALVRELERKAFMGHFDRPGLMGVVRQRNDRAYATKIRVLTIGQQLRALGLAEYLQLLGEPASARGARGPTLGRCSVLRSRPQRLELEPREQIEVPGREAGRAKCPVGIIGERGHDEQRIACADPAVERHELFGPERGGRRQRHDQKIAARGEVAPRFEGVEAVTE